MKKIIEVLRWHDGGPMTPADIGSHVFPNYYDNPVIANGHGGKGGCYTVMSPAQKVISPIRSLETRGLIHFARRPDGLSGTAYRLTKLGWQR
jgi:hypothetical protein